LLDVRLCTGHEWLGAPVVLLSRHVTTGPVYADCCTPDFEPKRSCVFALD